MSLTVSAKSTYEPLKPGTYPAVCVGVIDLGTQTSQYGENQKIYLDFNADADGEVRAIGAMYTASLSSKAKLREHLENWRGRPFTDDELAGFKLTNVLGKSCLLTVGNRTSGDKTRDTIDAITSLPSTTKAPTVTDADLVAFDLSDPQPAVYSALPEWLQKMIQKAPEFAPPPKPTAPTTSNVVDLDADVPF